MPFNCMRSTLVILVLNAIRASAGWTNRLYVMSHVAFALHAAPPSPHNRQGSALPPRAQSNDADGALKFDRQAAEAGDVSAQCQLARAYRTGDGVTQSASEAAQWYRKAADQGYAEAQFNLGVCYAKGFGVDQNLACSADWLQAAAEQGHEKALAACTQARSEALALRVEREANIMPTPSPLLPPPLHMDTSVTSSSSGNPAAPSPGPDLIGPAEAREAALAEHGVVRVNGALSPATAAALRGDILKRRSSAYAAVASGAQPPDFEFGTFMQYAERCDLLLPLEGNHAVQCALRELLCGNPTSNDRSAIGSSGNIIEGSLLSDATTPLYDLLLATVGDDAVLYELAALISEPGAPRQPVHSDSPWQAATSLEPPLLTSFVALQSVTSAMGPTLFLPGTHGGARGGEAHAAYSESTASLDTLLCDRPNVEALLNVGDVSCFDSRTLHCGSANAKHGGSTRALFYVSFMNPRAAQPIGTAGSLRRDVKPLTLGSLRAKLSKLSVSGEIPDPFVCSNKPEESRIVDRNEVPGRNTMHPQKKS